jgi:hypothetical protein
MANWQKSHSKRVSYPCRAGCSPSPSEAVGAPPCLCHTSKHSEYLLSLHLTTSHCPSGIHWVTTVHLQTRTQYSPILKVTT